MARVIKLKESGITNIVKKIISEQISVPGHSDAVVTACGPNAGFTGTATLNSSNRVLQCNGAVCTNNDLGNEFSFTTANGNYTAILDSFSNPVTCTFHATNCVFVDFIDSTDCGSATACPTCIDIDYCDCADWDGTTCTGVTTGTILKPTYFNTTVVPQVGDVYKSGNSPDRYIMTATPNTDPNNMGTNCVQSIGVTCPATTSNDCSNQLDIGCWVCKDPINFPGCQEIIDINQVNMATGYGLQGFNSQQDCVTSTPCGQGGAPSVNGPKKPKKPIKLKESDLTNIVKKIISEQFGACSPFTMPPMGGCPQGETWQGYPVCECEPTPPQEWCCMGSGLSNPWNQTANCQQMNVGQCNPNSQFVNAGPFPTYQDCNDDCGNSQGGTPCTLFTPPGACPQGEIWQGYPNCECITAPPPPAQTKKVWFEPCKWNYNPVTVDRTKKMTIDGQTPVVGDIFEIDLGPQDGFWNQSMVGAFVPMRVVHVAQPTLFPFLPILDFDSSHCKSLPPHEPIGISHAKVAKGGDKGGWIDKTEKEAPGEERQEPIKLKESDLTKIVKRLIHEQTNPFSGGGSGPNWDAAQAAWTNWNSETQGGAPQADATFLSNMAGKGCGFYEKRLKAQVNSFVSQFGGSFGSGANQTNTSGGMNPAWQSQKYARIMWLSDKVQDCNSTSSNVSQCIIDFIDNPANDGPLDSAMCANGNQAINPTNKENTKFRHRSIADCGMLDNKLVALTDIIATSTGCMQIRKQAKYDWLTSLKNSCC